MKSNIGWLIRKAGLTQKEVADQLGVSVQTVNHWAKSKQYPRMDKAQHMCILLKCEIKDLYED